MPVPDAMHAPGDLPWQAESAPHVVSHTLFLVAPTQPTAGVGVVVEVHAFPETVHPELQLVTA